MAPARLCFGSIPRVEKVLRCQGRYALTGMQNTEYAQHTEQLHQKHGQVEQGGSGIRGVKRDSIAIKGMSDSTADKKQQKERERRRKKGDILCRIPANRLPQYGSAAEKRQPEGKEIACQHTKRSEKGWMGTAEQKREKGQYGLENAVADLCKLHCEQGGKKGISGRSAAENRAIQEQQGGKQEKFAEDRQGQENSKAGEQEQGQYPQRSRPFSQKPAKKQPLRQNLPKAGKAGIKRGKTKCQSSNLLCSMRRSTAAENCLPRRRETGTLSPFARNARPFWQLFRQSRFTR